MDLQKIFEKIDISEKILIVPSQPADLDCLSSALIMRWYILRRFNKKEVKIYSFFFIPDKLKIFPEVKDIQERYLNNVELNYYDLIIGVDGNDLSRYFTNSYEKYLIADEMREKFINFDHHLIVEKNVFLDNFNVTDSNAASTSVLLYKLLLKDISDIPSQVLTWVYAGLVGDTGGFKWNINSEVLRISADLIEKGADYRLVNESHVPLLEVHFAKWALENTTYLNDIRTTLLLIDQSSYKVLDDFLGGESWDFKDVDRYYKDTFCKSIEGFDYYLILKVDRKSNNIRITWRMRDLPKVRVNFIQMIKELGYDGGGHLNSASARVSNSSIDKVRSEIVSFITSLISSAN